MKQFMVMKVGDGKKANIWFDNWSPLGSLINHLTYRDLYDARFRTDTRIGELMVNGNWKWPEEWYVEYPTIT